MTYTGVTSKQDIARLFASDNHLQVQVRRFFDYKEYHQDVIQDIILQILEMNNEERLISICHKNHFNFWLFNILKAQKYDSKSKTNKNYTSKHSELFDSVQQTENSFISKENDEHRNYLIQLIKEELALIDKKNWYNAKVFIEYADMKERYRQEGKKLTFKEFGLQSNNINKDSLFQVIKKVKIKLKKRLNDEL